MSRDAKIVRNEKGEIIKIDGKHVLLGYAEWVKKDWERMMLEKNKCKKTNEMTSRNTCHYMMEGDKCEYYKECWKD